MSNSTEWFRHEVRAMSTSPPTRLYKVIFEIAGVSDHRRFTARATSRIEEQAWAEAYLSKEYAGQEWRILAVMLPSQSDAVLGFTRDKVRARIKAIRRWRQLIEDAEDAACSENASRSNTTTIINSTPGMSLGV